MNLRRLCMAFGAALVAMVVLGTFMWVDRPTPTEAQDGGNPLDPARHHPGQRVHIRKMSISAYEVKGLRDAAPLVYLHDLEVVPSTDMKSIRIQVKEQGAGDYSPLNPRSAVCKLPIRYAAPGAPLPTYTPWEILRTTAKCKSDGLSGTPVPDHSLKIRQPTATPDINGVIHTPVVPEELNRGNTIDYTDIAVVLQNLLSDVIRRPDELPSIVFYTVDDFERSIPPTSTPTETPSPVPFIGKILEKTRLLGAGLALQVHTATPTITPTPSTLYELYTGNTVLTVLNPGQFPANKSDSLMPQFIKHPDADSNEILIKSWYDKLTEDVSDTKPELDGIRVDPYEDNRIKLLEHVCPVFSNVQDLTRGSARGWQLSKVTLNSRHLAEATITTTPYPPFPTMFPGYLEYQTPTPNPVPELATPRAWLGPQTVIDFTTPYPTGPMDPTYGPTTGTWLELTIDGFCNPTVDVTIKDIYYALGELRGWPAGSCGINPNSKGSPGGSGRPRTTCNSILNPSEDYSPPYRNEILPTGTPGGNPLGDPVHGHPLRGDHTTEATVKNVLVRANLSAAVVTPTPTQTATYTPSPTPGMPATTTPTPTRTLTPTPEPYYGPVFSFTYNTPTPTQTPTVTNTPVPPPTGTPWPDFNAFRRETYFQPIVDFTPMATPAVMGGGQPISPRRFAFTPDDGLWVDLHAKPEDYIYPLTHQVLLVLEIYYELEYEVPEPEVAFACSTFTPTPTPTHTPIPPPRNHDPDVDGPWTDADKWPYPKFPYSTAVPGHPRCEVDWHHTDPGPRTQQDSFAGRNVTQTITFNETVLMLLPETQPPLVATPVYRGSGQPRVMSDDEREYYGQSSDEHYELQFTIAPDTPFDPRIAETPFPLRDATPNPNFPFGSEDAVDNRPEWLKRLLPWSN